MKIYTTRFDHGVMACLLFVLLLSPAASAQGPARGAGWQLGIHGGATIAMPSASFAALPGVANCLDSGTFTSGSGGGFIAAAVARYLPAAGDGFASNLGYSVRLGYGQGSTEFETSERIGSASDAQGNLESVMAGYIVETTISTLLLEPTVHYRMSGLNLNLGGSIGYTLGGSFAQRERLISPSDAQYVDGTTERNVSEGTFSSDNLSSIRAGMTIGAGYEISLSPLVTLIPEISYLVALGSPVRDVDWSANELRGGITLLIAPPPLQSNPLEPRQE